MRIKSKSTLILTHFKALFLKRTRSFKRDLNQLFCEVLLPCLIVILGLAILKITFIVNSPAK
jgi:ATP-binding cassette, subfamily A (ABC1), member 3